ncbi:unnamed protein product, partial [Effrenium voratum]
MALRRRALAELQRLKASGESELAIETLVFALRAPTWHTFAAFAQRAAEEELQELCANAGEAEHDRLESDAVPAADRDGPDIAADSGTLHRLGGADFAEPNLVASHFDAPDVTAPALAAPEDMMAPDFAAPNSGEPDSATPDLDDFVTSDLAAPNMAAPDMDDLVTPDLAAPSLAAQDLDDFVTSDLAAPKLAAPDPDDLVTPELAAPSLAAPDLDDFVTPDLAPPNLAASDADNLVMPDLAAPSLAAPDLDDFVTSDLAAPNLAAPDPDDLVTPDFAAPNSGQPDSATLDLDDLVTPDLAAPNLPVPDLAAPDLDDLITPDLAAPNLAAPDLNVSDMTMPDFASPNLAETDCTTPDVITSNSVPPNFEELDATKDICTGSSAAKETTSKMPKQGSLYSQFAAPKPDAAAAEAEAELRRERLEMARQRWASIPEHRHGNNKISGEPGASSGSVPEDPEEVRQDQAAGQRPDPLEPMGEPGAPRTLEVPERDSMPLPSFYGGNGATARRGDGGDGRDFGEHLIKTGMPRVEETEPKPDQEAVELVPPIEAEGVESLEPELPAECGQAEVEKASPANAASAGGNDAADWTPSLWRAKSGDEPLMGRSWRAKDLRSKETEAPQEAELETEPIEAGVESLRQERDQHRQQGDFEKALALSQRLVTLAPTGENQLRLAVARLECGGQDQQAFQELKDLQAACAGCQEPLPEEFSNWLRVARHWAVQPDRINHYRALQVPADATSAQVKQAYRKALLLWHPDKSGGDAARFRAAQEAWETLGSEIMRRVYDCGSLGEKSRPRPPAPGPAEPDPKGRRHYSSSVNYSMGRQPVPAALPAAPVPQAPALALAQVGGAPASQRGAEKDSESNRAKAKEPARAPRKQPEEPPAQVQGPPEQVASAPVGAALREFTGRRGPVAVEQTILGLGISLLNAFMLRQAHPVQAEPASIQPPVEKPVLKTRGSIYALEPNKKWVQPSLAFVKYGVTMCLTAGLCFLWQPSFKTLRLVYTLIGAGLLLYRIYYYAYKEWMLYFIDLCFVNSILLIWSLWYCTEGQCSKEWLLAVYMMAQGPVAGATFPLQTPLTLHHPEAFESFFLHASPMWLSYAVRWRWTDALLQPTPSVGELVSAGLYKLYLPWSISYLSFLLLQPFLPDRLAGLETLMDGFIFPAATKTLRLQGKRKNYLSFAPTVMAATLAHALLSASGLLAAALAFQHHSVQVAWIACVVLGCLVSGFRFYHLC